MKQKSRKALAFFFLAFVFVVGLLIVSLNSLVDRNREGIREEIQQALGRSITFDKIRLNLWSGLGLIAKNLRIADDPRFAATPLIQTKEVKMQVRWLPLLVGKIEIKKFILLEPEIQIIRNEKGKFNLFALGAPKKRPGGTQGPRVAKEIPPVGFSVSGVEVRRGKIHYVDRSSKEPVEIRLHNLDLNLNALAITQAVKIKLKANLQDGDTQNITLEGWVGPLTSVKEWTEYHLDLQMGIDSLLVPQLTSAVPFLNDKFPSYLDITGPLTIRTKVLGTVRQPHITGLTLEGAVFGSPTNNLQLTADVDLSNGDLNHDTKIKGKLVLEPVTLERLKKIPLLEGFLPTQLTSQGPLGIVSEFEGTFQDFKVNTLIKADDSEIGYGAWFKKPKGVPAKMQVRIARKNNKLSLDPSNLSIHNLNLDFAGSLEESPERLLRLRIRTDAVDLAGWEKLLLPGSSYDLAGEVGFNLSIRKMFSPQGNDLDVRGFLTLDDLRVSDKKSGRRMEKITAQMIFKGKEAEVEKLQLRLGSSDFTIQGILDNLTNPTLRYRLRSPKLNLVDLTDLPEYKSDWMKDFTSEGEFQIKNGTPSVDAEISLGEGLLQELSYQNLNGVIEWRPDKLGVKDLTFQALGGSFKGSGTWERGDGQKPNFTFTPHIRGMDLKELLPRVSPEFGDGVQGSLNLAAKLEGSGKNWESVKRTLQGQGHAEIIKGSLKDFNLVKRVLTRVTGLPGIGNLISSNLSPRYARIFERRDTPFDTLEATFTVNEGRIGTKDLLMANPDYLIQAQGWVGLDSSMQWNATLALSPPLTQELMQKHKNVRHLVDSQGRLGVPFRLAGKLPRVQPKPDIKLLAELIQRGLLQKGGEETIGGKKSDKNKSDHHWIRKGLEQLLGK
jgi:uncharacterized protein involved in outer membrane biogenesis